MHPVLAKIGPITIYSYGVMVAIGFALATYLASERAKTFGIDKNRIIDLALVILLFGLIGARLNYVILNLNYYRNHPLEMIFLNRGGLVFYGSLLLGLGAGFVYVRRNRLSFWKVSDLMSPYVALGHSIGRIGCLLNGCCWGKVVSKAYPFGLCFPGQTLPRHPTQLYASMILLAIAIVLRVRQEKDHFDGQIFLLYCLLYSTQRFFVEFLRGDIPIAFFGLTFSQVVSIAIFSVSSIIFATKWKIIRSR